VVFTDNVGKDSEVYPFDFEIVNIYGIIRQLYHNTLCVDNASGAYSSFQWTNGGSDIDGETNQYLHINGGLKGSYTVWADMDGNRFESCPFEVRNAPTSKNSSSIRIYPNPVTASQVFTIEILDYDPDAKSEIIIHNASGSVVKTIPNAVQLNMLSLPAGNYAGALLVNGVKTGFKIIVK
jgi:hypothetical protein